MSKAPSESEHLKDMLVGSIRAISLDHARAEKTGLNIRWWDALFYASC